MATNADPASVLRTLPTQPGSVIGNAKIVEGLMVFETMVLSSSADADRGGLHWHDLGGNRYRADELAVWLTLEDWTLVGVVPLGDNERTPEQEAAWAVREQRMSAAPDSNDIPW